MKSLVAGVGAALAATAANAGAVVTPVPEPGALGLLAFGAVTAIYLVRRRK